MADPGTYDIACVVQNHVSAMVRAAGRGDADLVIAAALHAQEKLDEVLSHYGVTRDAEPATERQPGATHQHASVCGMCGQRCEAFVSRGGKSACIECIDHFAETAAGNIQAAIQILRRVQLRKPPMPKVEA